MSSWRECGGSAGDHPTRWLIMTVIPYMLEAVVIEGQMGSQPLNGNDARALLGIVWGWINDPDRQGYGGGARDLERELRQAGYGPLEVAE